MQRILSGVCGIIVTLSTAAQTIVPDPVFSENFQQSVIDGRLPDGWITYGSGNVAADKWTKYFGDKGEAPYYRPFTIENVSAAWSNTTYTYAASGDEWLVTPKIHIDDNTQLLQFTAYAFGGFETNRYRVLISETGQEKDSFRMSPLINTTLKGTTTIPYNKTSYVELNGYEGKDIYLAFVNKSTDGDLLGFTDISVCPYSIKLSSLTPEVLPAGSIFNISFTADVRLPVNVETFTVTLTTSDGSTDTRKVNQACGLSGARFSVTYDDMVLPEEGITYHVEITPDYEGAQPTVLYGEVNVPMTSYPPVAVIEEFTGSWCVNCPRGAAFLEYYSDVYNGESDNCKAIGIALHNSMDPMYIRRSSYFDDAYAASGAVGYPSAFFNRSKLGDPSDKEIVEEIAATRSHSLIGINKVTWYEGEQIKVDYYVTHAYNMNRMNRKVAFVVIENNVHSDASGYEQSNGLSGATKYAVENTYGEGLWPYFKFFCESPELIPAADMYYNHVARGIYPDYSGLSLSSPCMAEVPIGMTASFDMPSNVMNPENTAVIALLLNSNNGEIVSAYEVKAAQYNRDLSSVETVTADFATVVRNGKIISIASRSPFMVELFSADGRRLSATEFDSEATHQVNCAGLSGIVIARVSDSEGNIIVRKYVF